MDLVFEQLDKPILSNLNKKTAGGVSHPTIRKGRVQIVDADNDFTGDGKHNVDIGCKIDGIYLIDDY
ncbi:MAG: hypothetical protein EZS28_045364 [Streblomastix strix]|uniref:Uncharacterized protein n=1 Tax=Streblomastix strix TaxID=222440 RepID=A0A5J4TLD0_9EUKA|nr:MAG: hypothetical protein EZS28_045364 [Streblomastix strix]